VADEDDAKQDLTTFGGLADEDADALIAGVVSAAQQEVLDHIAGVAPVPSNALVTSAPCACATSAPPSGRMLSRREVELLFRLAPSTADSVIRRMQVLYPAAVEDYLAALVARGSVTATGTAGGSDEGWEIYFPGRRLRPGNHIAWSGQCSSRRSALSSRSSTSVSSVLTPRV